MSYRIEYDGRVGRYELREERHACPAILAVVGLFALLTFCFWPVGAERVRSFLIPGEDTVTIQAFSSMTEDLRGGAGIRDAIEGFCHRVVHGQ